MISAMTTIMIIINPGPRAARAAACSAAWPAHPRRGPTWP